MLIHKCVNIGTKVDIRDVLRVSVPKGLIFLYLKEGVIPMNILIGNLRIYSRTMI